jgi:hypothetical protein
MRKASAAGRLRSLFARSNASAAGLAPPPAGKEEFRRQSPRQQKSILPNEANFRRFPRLPKNAKAQKSHSSPAIEPPPRHARTAAFLRTWGVIVK